MNVFNIKNPRHAQILKEELTRAKRILTEGYQYSVDEIWNAMTAEEKAFLMLSSDDDEGPDREEQYATSEWDNIPADVQDVLDLSNYELAKYDQGGRTNLRAINNFMTQSPNVSRLINAFLKKVGRTRVNDLTIKQSTQLLMAIHQFNSAGGTDKPWNPNDASTKGDWIARQTNRSGLD